jgi:hypothetical protein
VAVQPEYPQAMPPRRVFPLVPTVVGAVIGAVVVGLVWVLVAVTSGSGGAGSDAAAACEVLDRVGELKPVKGLPTRDSGSGLTPEMADRLGAARLLAEAAARGGSEYDALSEALKKAHQMINVSFRVNDESIGQLDEARRLCDEL